MTIPAIAPELSPDDDVEPTDADDDTYDEDADDEDEYETNNGADEDDKEAIRDVTADDIGKGPPPVELLVELNRVTTTASMTNA